MAIKIVGLGLKFNQPTNQRGTTTDGGKRRANDDGTSETTETVNGRRGQTTGPQLMDG